MRPRILITRAPHQASALADALRALGCDPILIPTIELAPPSTFEPLDAALANLHTFDWLIFTSANAVEAFHHRLTHHQNSTAPAKHHQASTGVATGNQDSTEPAKHHQASTGLATGNQSSTEPAKHHQASNGLAVGFSPRNQNPGNERALAPVLPPHLRIASIGPATSRAISQLLGTEPSLVPPQAVAESLAAALLALTEDPHQAPFSRRFLFPRAEDARNVLEEALKHTKTELTIVPVYRNIIPAASIPAIRELFSTPASYPDAITFTSSSTATNLLALLEVSGIPLPPEIPRISIGPITTQTLHDLHISPTAESPEPTIPALADTVVKALQIK